MKVSIPKTKIILRNGEELVVDADKKQKLDKALSQDGTTHINLSDYDRTISKHEIKDVRRIVQEENRSVAFSKEEIREADQALQKLQDEHGAILGEKKWLASKPSCGKVVNGQFVVDEPGMYRKWSELLNEVYDKQAKREYAKDQELKELEKIKETIGS